MNIKVTDMRVSLGDSAFLIDDGKTSILYDSGFGFTGAELTNKLKEYLGSRKLDYIFLTHSHYDHVFGSAYVLNYYKDAVVVAGEYVANIFQRPSAKAVMKDLDRKFALKCGVENYCDLIENLRVDVAVKDGDIVKAGDMEFVAVALPGHTKCSFGFYMPSEKFLLGTETLGVYNGVDDVVPSYLIGYKITLDSIQKAQNMDIQNILVPHYGLLNEKQTKLYLQKSKSNAVEVANDIAALLTNGGTDNDALEYFKKRFYHGYIKEIYPVDAMELNTSIAVKLIKQEFNI